MESKKEIIDSFLNKQKSYIGQKKDIIDEEKALVDSFIKERISSELSFIDQCRIIKEDEACKEIIDKLNSPEELVKVIK